MTEVVRLLQENSFAPGVLEYLVRDHATACIPVVCDLVPLALARLNGLLAQLIPLVALHRNLETSSVFLHKLMKGNVDRVDCQWPSQLKLRPYQEEGVAWLHFLASHNLHGILADDMGLGKTLQVLSSVVFLRRQDNDLKDFCTLVICPPLVASHWVREVETYFSDDFPRIVVYTGTTAQRKVLRRQHYHSTKYWSAELVVVSYSVLQHDREYFDQQNFTFCIADEVHLCRNPLSLTSQALFALKATYRIALSGTPIQNSAVDIWSVFSFLMPGFLGDYATFKRHTVQPILLSRGDTATAAQKDTIEDEILNAQRFKQAMADTVLGPNETKSGNNILQVLQSGFDQNQPPPKKRRRAKPGVQGLLDELEELWDTAHRLTRNSWSVDPHLLEAFLAEDNLRFINGGLQRHDIEQL
ncbi:unnamed protein product [Aphanomyces euteiches]